MALGPVAWARLQHLGLNRDQHAGLNHLLNSSVMTTHALVCTGHGVADTRLKQGTSDWGELSEALYSVTLPQIFRDSLGLLSERCLSLLRGLPDPRGRGTAKHAWRQRKRFSLDAECGDLNAGGST
ncbi:hypothetical protein CC2G_001434 [Coprinopsis cinerea AmutBmut pab1-1]|nr:hypothetical protein CC2G_001434 [Coprinopsis cinerea AmutBmut pab1-1]